MKTALLALACVTSSWAAPVQSVPALDLERYLGKWYEIASYPMFFQRHCVADTTAEYSLDKAGEVLVKNRCRREDGSFDEANGKASVVPDSGNAQLKVSFFWPFSAPYWVIGLAPDYGWAVVGHPDRKYLWILSRTPRLDGQQLAAARAAIAAQGYDLDKLRTTVQSTP